MISRRKIAVMVLIAYLILIFSQTTLLGLSFVDDFGLSLNNEKNTSWSFGYGEGHSPDLIIENNFQSQVPMSSQRGMFLNFLWLLIIVILSCQIAIISYLFNNKQIFYKNSNNFYSIPVGILAPPIWLLK